MTNLRDWVAMDLRNALSLIRKIPDYPKAGILFQDLTPLLADPRAFNAVIEKMSEHVDGSDIVAGIEARGFIFGSAIASHKNLGFVPIRKSGKLPSKTYSAQYGLEYGVDTIEVHVDAFSPGQRVALVDDVLATGGTINAAIELVEKCGATVELVIVLLELGQLRGRDKIKEAYPEVEIMSIHLT